MFWEVYTNLRSNLKIDAWMQVLNHDVTKIASYTLQVCLTTKESL